MNKISIKRTFAYILAVLLIVGILSIISGLIFFFMEILGVNTKKEDNFKTEITNLRKENIKKINIDLKYADLSILKSKDLKIESDNKNINIKEENDEVKIEEKGVKSKISFGANNKRSKLKIYIPENMNFQNVKINSEVGKIDIENLITDNLKIEAGIGNIFLKAKVEKMAKIEAGIGKINYDILNDPNDVNIKIERGLGQIYFNDSKLEEDEIGNGKVKIGIEAGIGKVEIFNKEKRVNTLN